MGNTKLAAPRAAEPTVLVIDDDRHVLFALAAMLETAGCRVETADDGRAGVSAFRRCAPDLVITDLIMPEQNGVATIMELKREHPQAKIIAISGGGRIGLMDLLSIAGRLGADAILQKPFDVGALLSIVRSLLARSSEPHAQPSAA